MELYKQLIENTLSQLTAAESFAFNSAEICKKTNSETLILSKDAAFEYGSMGLAAVNTALFCTDESITDSVIISGTDISKTKKDTPYARIAIISLKKDNITDDDTLYKQLKDIELSKYHVYPDGCLIRLSPESKREQIRVSKKAVSDGLSLKNIGFAFIEEYKKHLAVKAVTIVFFTGDEHNYKALEADSKKAADITQSLNKILNGLEISCESCSLKAICDEVEGLRELHFGKDK